MASHHHGASPAVRLCIARDGRLEDATAVLGERSDRIDANMVRSECFVSRSEPRKQRRRELGSTTSRQVISASRETWDRHQQSKTLLSIAEIHSVVLADRIRFDSHKARLAAPALSERKDSVASGLCELIEFNHPSTSSCEIDRLRTPHICRTVFLSDCSSMRVCARGLHRRSLVLVLRLCCAHGT